MRTSKPVGLLAACFAAACGSSPATVGTADAAPHRDATSVTTDAHTDARTDGHLASDAAPSPRTPTTPGDAGDAAPGDAGILGARPYNLHVPTGYDAKTATPLVVMFHGYGASALIQETYFQLTATSDARTFLYAYANGTLDKTGERFWNATNACCDFYGDPVDDVAYFDAIVADVEAKYTVDRKRIFVVGHSNGGFMSHRLACDRSETVAAILSLAGAVWDDPTKCSPTAHVSVAEVHGNADTVIPYDGGSTQEGPFPSAPTTVATWAARNGCTGSLAPTGATLDLDVVLPGNETVVQQYGACPAGIDVQLWTIQGGAHIPSLGYPGWGDAVWGFLSTHPKP